MKLGSALMTIFVGVLMGGFVSSMALVAVPDRWRGDWIPIVFGSVGVVGAFLGRRFIHGPSHPDARPTGRRDRVD